MKDAKLRQISTRLHSVL